MKCLSATQTLLLASGTVLHDWHAEILAIRAFNHSLLHEARSLASSSAYQSSILRHRQVDGVAPQSFGHQPITLREGLKIMMYCSEAPCGDASMELVMEAQEDATPWPVADSSDKIAPVLLGRESFSQLGVVRRKPCTLLLSIKLGKILNEFVEARRDAPPTLSKSCSDKLALKQCTSILSSTTSLLISPENAYLDTLILPKSQYRPEACERSFGPQGRLQPVADRTWGDGHAFHPFRVRTTDLDFSYSRRNAIANSNGESKGCNISVVWTLGLQETLINGVLQGRKQTDPKGASALSKAKIWDLFLELHELVVSDDSTLIDMGPSLIRGYVKKVVKEEALQGWDQGAV